VRARSKWEFPSIGRLAGVARDVPLTQFGTMWSHGRARIGDSIRHLQSTYCKISIEYSYFTNRTVALIRTHGDGPAEVAGLEHQLSDRPFTRFEAAMP
jgi:hypothetical protein